jgi:O-antigen chain-terminating methyltransferase
LDSKAVRSLAGEREDKKSASEGGPVPDVPALMSKIRERVEKEIAGQRDRAPTFHPTPTDPAITGSRKAGELLHSEELRYLNAHFGFSGQLNLDTITTHRKGLIGGALGKVIVGFKRKVLRIIWDSLLKDYFLAERAYQANLVRFLNDVSKYVDARDASNFWELIRKIDVDIGRALERIERIHDEYEGALHTAESRMYRALENTVRELQQNLRTLNADTARHEDRMRTLESVSRGLEGNVAHLDTYQGGVRNAEAAPPAKALPDFSYLLLENRYRGSEEAVAGRLAIYPPLFKSAPGAVLEIGAGRGELLSLFADERVPAYGVDVDEAMVKTAASRGVDVRLGDGISHLRSLGARSLGGVIAVQVAEHLTRAQLEELLTLCRSRVAPGGLIVLETINPRSVLALSSNYFRDPTHVWPLHPDTLGYTMTLAGLEVQEVRMLSPVPAESTLAELPAEEFLTPRWQELVAAFNRNIARLNDLLYGYQDYCIVARVPA